VKIKVQVVVRIYVKTRNSSGDVIANVNFFYNDIVFGEITQNKGHYAVQGHLRRSRSFNVTDFGTNRKLMYHVPISD